MEKTYQEKSTMVVQIENNENLQSMDINNTPLMDFLNIETDTEDFENALMPFLPITLSVLFCNGCITDIIRKI